MLIITSSWVTPNFWKTFGERWKVFCTCLVSAALFPHCAIILENKLETLVTKSSVLRDPVTIWRSSEYIDPEEIVDGIYCLTNGTFGL